MFQVLRWKYRLPVLIMLLMLLCQKCFCGRFSPGTNPFRQLVIGKKELALPSLEIKDHTFSKKETSLASSFKQYAWPFLAKFPLLSPACLHGRAHWSWEAFPYVARLARSYLNDSSYLVKNKLAILEFSFFTTASSRKRGAFYSSNFRYPMPEKEGR